MDHVARTHDLAVAVVSCCPQTNALIEIRVLGSSRFDWTVGHHETMRWPFSSIFRLSIEEGSGRSIFVKKRCT